MQSHPMETNWAAEHLQTIRTLMERSAIYRRALAPIMVFCGVAGMAGGGVGWGLRIDSPRGFVLFWAGVAAVALAGTFLLVRRQALKESEPFWSPPTRRVTQALIPPFFIGVVVSTVIAFGGDDGNSEPALILIWSWLFGCALNAAGFFMPRGIKVFGWLFIVMGCILTICLVCEAESGANPLFNISPHLLMGGIFGGLHLAYGIYLYFVEKGKNAA